MSDEIKVGATVNSKYELMSVLGKGRKATVYKGYQHFAKKSAALKIMDVQAKISADDLKRFQRETKLLTALHAHKGIVNVLDFGAAGIGQAFLVMDLIEGQTLRQLLGEKTRLDSVATVSIFRQVIEALGYVHVKQIVHAGLSPSEIMLTPSDKDNVYAATIVDFGSAKSTDSAGQTTTGEPCAEPQYASPEVSAGENFDARADIYSVGCMLYETLVGKLPEANPPVFPADIEVPEALQSVIIKAMNTDPAKRFPTMNEMVAALPRGSSTSSTAEKKDLWGSIKGMFK